MDDATVIVGTSASGGVAVGHVVRLQTADASAGLGPDVEGDEARRLLETSREALSRELAQRSAEAAQADEREIFKAHAALVRDPQLLDIALRQVAAGSRPAAALQAARDELAAQLRASSSERFRERAADLEDVVTQWLRLLAGGKAPDRTVLPDDAVVVAEDLPPSVTAGLDRSHVRAFVLSGGGPTAHTAILARGYGIPAVVRIGARADELDDGTLVVVDGDTGTVEPNPAPERMDSARRRMAQRTAAVRVQGRGHTADGREIILAGNAGSSDEVAMAAAAGAEEIGLFRTEFVYLEHVELPTESEQTEVYRAAVEAMRGGRVTFRTLDVGGDKPLPALPMPPEDNPMLGNRGIRLWSANPALARAQLRAMLRASAFGPVGVMFPMVSRVEELDEALSAFDAARTELMSEGVAVGDDITRGVMIETPAAVMCADKLAARCDFLSLGTNDLLQYLFAADRDNPAAGNLLDSAHPALLRAAALVVRAAEGTPVRVAVCGESAADPDVQLALTGIGVTELSMVPADLAATAANLAAHPFEQLAEAARRAMDAQDAAQSRAVLRALRSGEATSSPVAAPTAAPEPREGGNGLWTVDVVVAGSEGLHARPASELVELASTFAADVTLTVAGREADAKSMLAVLALGADEGAEVHVETRGQDAEPAIRAVAAAIAEPD